MTQQIEDRLDCLPLPNSIWSFFINIEIFIHCISLTAMEQSSSQVAVITVPLPAQGHLNQMLQFSSLVSSYRIPVYYVGSALHNRQARARINCLSPQEISEIHFHDITTPPFPSPPPNPNSTNKFPAHLLPIWEATLQLRRPVAAFVREMANKFQRVVVVHDPAMVPVVQDVSSVLNAELYAFNCLSAFFSISILYEIQGKPFPVEHPKELPSFEGCYSDDAEYYGVLKIESLAYKAGDLYNTCRLIEAPYMEVLERDEVVANRKYWAIGPILATKLSSSDNQLENQHQCLKWLDEQEPKSVIYVAFGSTVSLSDEEIAELASGLERSKVKFLWVLRNADRCNAFDEQVRRLLPEGFEERVEGVGMVVRDWAPQPRILGHPSTGGFMSHCGWNSCIESITMGVPLAAWPMHSDQPRNTALVADILKTGIVVREWKQRMEVVKASTIENAVRRLMATEEGHAIRKRAEELGVAVRQATQPGGVSRLELDSYIAHITR